MTYMEQLRDPRWLKMRFFKLQSVGWSCERCGHSDRPFQVHHPKYKPGRAPWEYWITELEALCDVCHAEAHGKRETSPVVAVAYQAMAAAHRRGDWDAERFYAEEGMRAIEDGHYYQGLV